MLLAGIRPGQTLRRGGAPVSRLPEGSEITLAVGLKRDVFAVSRPDREPVVAAERQTPYRGAAGKVDDRDDRFGLVSRLHNGVLPVGRDSRKFVRTWRHLDGFNRAFDVRDYQARRVCRDAGRPRSINQHAAARDIKLRRSRLVVGATN